MKLAPALRSRRLPPACDHIKAEQVGTTKGKQLADGRWMFSARYSCPDCDAYFTEVHEQIRPRDQ